MSIHPLVIQHRNLIESEAAKYAHFVPLPVVEAEAYHIANAAVKTFDTTAGNRFSTHLTSQLKKLSRLSTEYGGDVRLPEHSQFQLNTVNRFIEEHKGNTGKDPSAAQIAKGTNLSLAKVSTLLRGVKHKHTVSGLTHDPVFVDNNSELDNHIHMVYHDLPERDKVIFEHYTGFGGKPLMGEPEIAKKLNISTGVVANRIKIIGEEIAKGVK